MTNGVNYPGGFGPTPRPPAAADCTAKPARPPEVRNAVKVWIANIVVGLVSSALTYTLTDPYATMQRQIQRSSRPGYTPYQNHTFLTALVVMTAVFTVVGIVLQVFFIMKMQAGRSWARIVLTVWAGIGIAGFLFGFLFQRTVISVVTGATSILLLGAALVLMYRPAASAYFRRAPVDVGSPTPWPPPPLMPPPDRPRVAELTSNHYVSWWTRVVGGLIDYGLPTLIFFVFYVPFGNGAFGMGGTRGALIMLAVIAVLIAFQIGNSAILQGRTGQSLGKQATKTRLVDEWTGRPLGAGTASGRLLAHLLDSVACYLGWLLPLLDRPKHQTFADKITHSIVVPADEALHQPEQLPRPA